MHTTRAAQPIEPKDKIQAVREAGRIDIFVVGQPFDVLL